MKEGQSLWTRSQLILAINLYCKLPYGKMHSRNPKVIELSKLIGRTPSAVARKLTNLASFDPELQERNIKGSSNSGKLDKIIWNEFYNNWDAALIESEKLLASYQHSTIEQINAVDESDIPQEGLNKQRLVNTRVNQSIFRRIVLATYNNACCITGITNTDLLIASHIVPWSLDSPNRLNPMNGLCLNALHDRAFDKGYLTVSAEDYTLKISSQLKTKEVLESMQHNFYNLENSIITLPSKFRPSKELLKRHNDFFKP